MSHLSFAIVIFYLHYHRFVGSLVIISVCCLHLPFGIHSVRFTLSTYYTIDPNKTPPVLTMLFWMAISLESFLFSNSFLIVLNIIILWRILGASSERKKLVCAHIRH